MQTWVGSRGAYIQIERGRYFYIPKELELHGITILTRGLDDNYLAAYLARICKPASTVIDIGANIGEMSVTFAEAVGPNGRVVAFEPIPFLADAITKTARINAYDHLTVVNAAVSVNSGTLHIDVRYSPDKIVDSGGSQVKQFPTGASVPVETFTLDAWCSANQSPNTDISLIKIDVEGHELQVLQGARRTLTDHKPALALEIGHESQQNRAEIAEILDEIGYSPSAVMFRAGFLPVTWDEIVLMDGPLEKGGGYNILFQCSPC